MGGTVDSLAEARLNSLLESSFDAVCMIDDREKVIYWNSQAENLYSLKREDILGRNIGDFFSNLILTTVLKEGAPVLGAYHQPRPGIYVLINAYPVCRGRNIIGSVSVERDITGMVLLNRDLVKANHKALSLQREIARLNTDPDPFKALAGHSRKLRETVALARKVAQTDAAVLLYGESGTGKEIFARALHQGSSRCGKPFVPINCGAIPYNLFESELFGYEGGAFTGAEKKGKPGKIALAHGGTFFLDEISELHPDLQVKLLRVLQEKAYFPVGGNRHRKVDMRVITATNQDLEQMVQQNKFRRDLYYRLNVVSLHIPPLRERKNDIPELAYLFLGEFSRRYGKRVSDIAPDVMTAFLRYHWPGNVRELRNVVERMVVLTEGHLLDLKTLPPEQGRSPHPAAREGEEGSLIHLVGGLERELIQQALGACRGNKARAAAALGIPRSTLYYRMKKLGING